MKNIIGLLTLVTLLFASTQSFAACSCAQSLDVSKAFSESDIIFSGKVMNKTKNAFGETTVSMKVFQKFKGNFSTTLDLAETNDICSKELQVSAKYLVYAKDEKGKITASQCSRTSDLSASAEELKQLSQLAKGETITPTTTVKKITPPKAATTLQKKKKTTNNLAQKKTPLPQIKATTPAKVTKTDTTKSKTLATTSSPKKKILSKEVETITPALATPKAKSTQQSTRAEILDKWAEEETKARKEIKVEKTDVDTKTSTMNFR